MIKADESDEKRGEEEDDDDDDDDVNGVDRQLVRMGYRFLVRGCKFL